MSDLHSADQVLTPELHAHIEKFGDLYWRAAKSLVKKNHEIPEDTKIDLITKLTLDALRSQLQYLKDPDSRAAVEQMLRNPTQIKAVFMVTALQIADSKRRYVPFGTQFIPGEFKDLVQQNPKASALQALEQTKLLIDPALFKPEASKDFLGEFKTNPDGSKQFELNPLGKGIAHFMETDIQMSLDQLYKNMANNQRAILTQKLVEARPAP